MSEGRYYAKIPGCILPMRQFLFNGTLFKMNVKESASSNVNNVAKLNLTWLTIYLLQNFSC